MGTNARLPGSRLARRVRAAQGAEADVSYSPKEQGPPVQALTWAETWQATLSRGPGAPLSQPRRGLTLLSPASCLSHFPSTHCVRCWDDQETQPCLPRDGPTPRQVRSPKSSASLGAGASVLCLGLAGPPRGVGVNGAGAGGVVPP